MGVVRGEYVDLIRIIMLTYVSINTGVDAARMKDTTGM